MIMRVCRPCKNTARNVRLWCQDRRVVDWGLWLKAVSSHPCFLGCQKPLCADEYGTAAGDNWDCTTLWRIKSWSHLAITIRMSESVKVFKHGFGLLCAGKKSGMWLKWVLWLILQDQYVNKLNACVLSYKCSIGTHAYYLILLRACVTQD